MSVLDLDALARAAADHAVAKIIEQLPRLLRAELQSGAEKLEPLDAILAISTKSACARINRDSELRALGVRIGKRLYFRRSVVENFYRAKTGAR